MGKPKIEAGREYWLSEKGRPQMMVVPVRQVGSFEAIHFPWHQQKEFRVMPNVQRGLWELDREVPQEEVGPNPYAHELNLRTLEQLNTAARRDRSARRLLWGLAITAAAVGAMLSAGAFVGAVTLITGKIIQAINL